MTSPAFSNRLRGLSFDIPEHIAVRAWAEASSLYLVTELDRVVGNEEYEEVLHLYDRDTSWHLLTLWRARGEIVAVQPDGAARRFSCIWDAISAAEGGMLGSLDQQPSRRLQ